MVFTKVKFAKIIVKIKKSIRMNTLF